MGEKEEDGKRGYENISAKPKQSKLNTFLVLVSDEKISETDFANLCASEQATLEDLSHEAERRLDEFFTYYFQADKPLFKEMFSLIKKSESRDESELYYPVFLKELNDRINSSYQLDKTLPANEIISNRLKLTYVMNHFFQKFFANPKLISLDEQSKKEMKQALKVGATFSMSHIAGLALGGVAEMTTSAAGHSYTAYKLVSVGDQKKSYFEKLKTNLNDTWNLIKEQANNLWQWSSENSAKAALGGVLFIGGALLSVVLLPVTLGMLAIGSAVSVGRLIKMGYNSQKGTQAGIARVDRFAELIEKLNSKSSDVDEHDANVALMKVRGLNMVEAPDSSTTMILKKGKFSNEIKPIELKENNEKESKQESSVKRDQTEEKRDDSIPVQPGFKNQ